MEITINKNQQRINFKTHVGNIITIAQQTAKQGVTRFNYDVPRGLGFGCYELIREVEKQTEESVYGSHKDGTITFRIQN